MKRLFAFKNNMLLLACLSVVFLAGCIAGLNESDILSSDISAEMGALPSFTPTPEKEAENGAGTMTEFYTQGDYEYTINEDGAAIIIKYLGIGGDIVIPAELDGKPVAAVGYRFDETTEDYLIGAFQNCSGLTSVVIPDGVTDIKDNAFRDCSALATVTVPASVKVIWNCAFAVCPSLEAIYFEGDAPQFANYVFDGAKQPVLYYHEEASGWTNPFYNCVTAAY